MRNTIALCLLLCAPLAAHASDWEQINDEDGIQVFSKEVAGSDLVAFRGVTVMEAPMQKVLWVLATNEHRTEWVDRLYISTVLDRASAHEYTIYQAFGLPAILSNRDYVYHAKATRDALTGVVTLEMSSVEYPGAPETVGVRANLINSRYTMTPMAGGKTEVDVEIHTDPKGWVPTWMVNIIQKSWPLKTLTGLRSQIGKPYVQLFPMPPLASVATK